MVSTRQRLTTTSSTLLPVTRLKATIIGSPVIQRPTRLTTLSSAITICSGFKESALRIKASSAVAARAAVTSARTGRTAPLSAGNLVHNINPVGFYFAYSLFWADNTQIINNTAINGNVGPQGGRLNLAFEWAGFNGSIFRGNVVKSVDVPTGYAGGGGWVSPVTTGYTSIGGMPCSPATCTVHYDNNVWMNDPLPTYNYGQGEQNLAWDQTTYIIGSDYQNNKPAAIAAITEGSQMSVSFTTPANQAVAQSGSGTWNVAVVSNLSVRSVQFYVDSSPTPVVTQQLQDVSSTFAADQSWRYHVTFDTTSLPSGSHVIRAVATDAAGQTQTATQTFTAGSGIAVSQLTPATVSFSSQVIGTSATAQAVKLSNTGTAALTIKSLSVSGPNAADFAATSGCGTSVAAGASCSVSIVFTPSTTGTESASLVLTDNSSASSHTAALSGIGAAAPQQAPAPPPAAPSQPTSLPTNLPKGMLLWLANDAGLVSNGTAVNLWQDQSGNGNNAVQTNSANQPSVVPGNNAQNALRFNGTSTFMSIPYVPIDGLSGMTVLMVAGNSKDMSTNGSYGFYSLLTWPEVANWGATYFSPFQTTSHFRFGTMQTGNENTSQMAFTRTNSFGLSEWIHSGTTDSLWFNSQSVATYAGKVASIGGVTNSALLGQGLNNTFFPGDVSEVIIYNRALSASERQTLEQYLMTKYHL